jgi:hypothetical protein
MDRDALHTVAIALLLLAVISVAAATIQTTTSQRDSGGVSSGAGGPVVGSADGNRSQGSMGDGMRGGGLPENKSASEGENRVDGICIPFFIKPKGILTLLLAVVGIWYALKKYKEPFFANVVTFIIVITGAHALVFVTDCVDGRFNMRVDTSSAIETGGGAAERIANSMHVFNDTTVHPAILVLGGVLVVVLGVALLLTRGDVDEGLVETVETDGDEGPDRHDSLEAIGRVAGQAADRIDGAGAFENEVYRAWAEMTAELDVDRPDSSTPGEFATEAVEAGMAPEDVDRLTDLFEKVRYGGRDPTADREQRAIETLRRIEDQYVDEGGEES